MATILRLLLSPLIYSYRRAWCSGRSIYEILVPHQKRETFYVHGRRLYDRCREHVILRGVNKMAAYQREDPTCVNIFPQIRMTGANVVRIVWLTDAAANLQAYPWVTVANMDAVIANCRANHMIPMIELHDATGDWSKLGSLVTFWTRADVVAVVNKHKEYLLLNIGNEVGNDLVQDEEFRAGYASAIDAIRGAGIKVPLVIDAAGYGQEMRYILNHASYLIARDPQKNLIFSLHVWWHYNHADAAADFKNAIKQVVAMNIPFIVGEFAGVCQRCDTLNNDSPYAAILDECHYNSVGWIAWEWGPGNEYGNPPCPEMNMTLDGLYKNLKPGWAKDVAIDHPYSIKRTAVTPYLIRHGSCYCDF